MSQIPPFLPDNQLLASVLSPAAQPGQLPTEDLRMLPIIEERAVIRRELVETGRVRFTRQVQETDEVISVPVQNEEVQVERVSLNLHFQPGPRRPPSATRAAP